MFSLETYVFDQSGGQGVEWGGGGGRCKFVNH